MLKQQLDADIKTAMLAGDKDKATVLRGLKSAILYEEVAKNAREDGLSEDAIVGVLSKELKKRHEAADLYAQGGRPELASKEKGEAAIIEGYLPAQLSDSEVKTLVDAEVAKHESPSMKDMGGIIAAVRIQSKGQADGALIARLVKEAIGA